MSNETTWRRNLTLLTDGDREQFRAAIERERGYTLTDQEIYVFERLAVVLIDKRIKKLMAMH